MGKPIVTPETPESLATEEEFSLWLAACDEQLAAGDPAGSLEELGAPPPLRERLERDTAWCRLVRQMWPQAIGSDLDATGLAPDDESSTPARAPAGPGRFEIRRELGRGAFGVVYLAYDPNLRREVALKVPRIEVHLTPDLRARFRNEATAAAGLDHPNIVPVYEAGEEASVCFIASAYCPGITLAAWLRQRTGPVPYRAAAGLVATLAEAVDHAHRRGVLHRDLKPSNILLETTVPSTPGGEGFDLVPRITDFGLAKFVEEPTSQSDAANPTMSGVILGTPSYMAPEQAQGLAHQVGTPADIYSLGVILYELLTGRPPFQEDSALDTLVLVRTQDPLPPSRLRPRLPRDLETICLKCLHKQPQARFPTARELADDLRRFLDGLPIRTRPIPAWERAFKWMRRRPALAALVGVGGVAALALAIVIGLANVRLQRERDRAEARRLEAVANLRRARDAVDRMLTQVSEERLKFIPQVEPVQLALLEDALSFYRDFVRQAHDDPEVLFGASQAYGRLGRTYNFLGRRDEALRCYDEALTLLKHLVSAFPGVAAYRNGLAQWHLAVTGPWREMGRQAEAEAALLNALALLEELAAADPTERRYREEQASAHNVRGMVLEELGKPSEAKPEYQKAIELFDELAARFPDEVRHRTQGAMVRNNLAVLIETDGQLDEAERIYRRNVELWDNLVANSPAPTNADYRSKLALMLDNLSVVLSKLGRKGEAERNLRRAVDLRSGLTKDYPNTPFHFTRLGDTLGGWSKLASDRGDFALARQLRERAIASKRKAVALAPQAPDLLDGLRDCHAALAETLIRMRAHEDAARTVAELVALAPGSGPESLRGASFLARCVPLAEADPALAQNRRAELAKNYGDRAVGLLRVAVKQGAGTVAALDGDRGLDPLRPRADFQALLAAPANLPATGSP
jgi:tetratricopeptide (TPR) repeat protein